MLKTPVIVATVVAGSFIALGAFAMVMMASTMDDWHWRMMGGRGSDPDKEPAAEGVTDVRIEDFGFQPARIVINAGTTVTWTNYDVPSHTVTSDEGDVLASDSLDQNDSYRLTFDQPGEYRYHCEPHPNMQGLVTVQAPGADQRLDGTAAPPAGVP